MKNKLHEDFLLSNAHPEFWKWAMGDNNPLNYKQEVEAWNKLHGCCFILNPDHESMSFDRWWAQYNRMWSLYKKEKCKF